MERKTNGPKNVKMRYVVIPEPNIYTTKIFI